MNEPNSIEEGIHACMIMAEYFVALSPSEQAEELRRDPKGYESLIRAAEIIALLATKGAAKRAGLKVLKGG